MSCSETTIGVSRETQERIRRLKRGGISYDELLNRMAEQFDPEKIE